MGTGTRKMKEKDIERLTADAELWESGQLGASAEHVRVVSDEEEKEIDAGLGLQLISIRLNKTLIEQLKCIAKLDGIGYQPLIRQVLTKYVKANEHRLDRFLSAAEAMERAEQLFMQAVRYKEKINTLAPLSNNRIAVESDYTTALDQSNSLFIQVHKNSSSAVLKQHAQLRLDQIKKLAQKNSHEQKYEPKRKYA
jgi:hypothetical protein